jgi:hypothetical protein
MKDPRVVLDNVRAKIPAGAKVLVAYQGSNGVLHLAQANLTQADVLQFGNSICSAGIKERVGLSG